MNYELRIKNFKKGFTLIELLIVIAIIGVLATLLMVNFVGVRQRARDAQRKSDLRQIQSALELYRADQGVYPISGSGNGNFPTACGNPFVSADGAVTYMTKIPCDPFGVTYYNGGNYYYQSGGITYNLQTCLENAGDKDGTTTQLPGSGSGCISSPPTYFMVTNP
jgi:general secretion pathway protein G